MRTKTREKDIKSTGNIGTLHPLKTIGPHLRTKGNVNKKYQPNQ